MRRPTKFGYFGEIRPNPTPAKLLPNFGTAAVDVSWK